METKEKPEWLTPRGGLDEVRFCEKFMMKHYIIYQDGAFFWPEGRIADEDRLRHLIYQELCDYVRSSVAAKVESLLSTLRLVASQTCLKEDPARDMMDIHTAKGTYSLDTGFSPMKNLCRYRLPVAYNPDAPTPEKWLKFLSDLLYEEDIPTLQEYLGYCLIPCTLGQKMLIITGKGGEGKSRIGVVMKALLGDNQNLGSIAKVEKSPFARADLQHILLMVDDDLKMEALDQTNYLKSIITAELPMDLERKGVQSYQGRLKVPFLAFGNGNLQALHDRSHGFFRRQLILEAKERDPKRKDDPYLAYALTKEAEGILLWCIEGLERLMINDFRFTMSKRARANLLRSMTEANSAEGFMTSQGYFRFDPEGSISSRALYECYCSWCEDNMHRPLSARSFSDFLIQNQNRFSIRSSKHIPSEQGKEVRGFLGIRR